MFSSYNNIPPDVTGAFFRPFQWNCNPTRPERDHYAGCILNNFAECTWQSRVTYVCTFKKNVNKSYLYPFSLVAPQFPSLISPHKRPLRCYLKGSIDFLFFSCSIAASKIAFAGSLLYVRTDCYIRVDKHRYLYQTIKSRDLEDPTTQYWVA